MKITVTDGPQANSQRCALAYALLDTLEPGDDHHDHCMAYTYDHATLRGRVTGIHHHRLDVTIEFVDAPALVPADRLAWRN